MSNERRGRDARPREEFIPAGRPLRVAIIGCGAVTRSCHLPVLAGHPGIRVAALVDTDAARAAQLGSLFGVTDIRTSLDGLDTTVADAAIVATPPALHAAGAIQLMSQGLHVLVEKPMALSHADAESMVAASRETNRVLAVSYFRRLFPAIRLFRASMDGAVVGVPEQVSAQVGSEYTWQLATLAGLRREAAGGGVLADMGSHVLDLLLYVTGGSFALSEYRDNSAGGVETDCTARFVAVLRGRTVPVALELSRTRTLSNTIRVDGTKGSLEWSFGERYRLKVEPHLSLIDPVSAEHRPFALEGRWSNEPERFGLEGFRAQVDDWYEAIVDGSTPQLSGESALESVRLIEECYLRRMPNPEIWFSEGLEATSRSRSESKPRRVLITGASGFIGCRLAERLHFASDWNVRALVRNPTRAVRLARMPVDIAVGDVLARTELDGALRSCDAVVHAAVGTSWRASERVAVNVDGTNRLLEAAKRAGVRRFIHLSTIAVYGDQVSGTITEHTPLAPKKGWDYAESKLKAERAVLAAGGPDFEVVVLRIAVVYGPFNMTVVGRPLQHLMTGRLVLRDCAHVPSNTIYVDNACAGIERALTAPAEDVNGEIFLLSDDDGFTWGEYFDHFAAAVDRRIELIESGDARSAANANGSGRKTWLRQTKELIVSPETKALARRALNTDPWGLPARWFIDRFPEAVSRIADVVRPETPFIYRRDESAPASAPFVIDPIHARVCADKAARVLGRTSVVPRDRALELTLAWARHASILPPAASVRSLRRTDHPVASA